MSNLTAHVRLRPIRFGFLVRPDDAQRLIEIFRVNTCLWGGQFNPIIPRLKTVPRWWDRHGRSFETAAQIVNGYLDFFEPDFLVEAEPGLADGLDFEPDRVIPLLSVLAREGQHKRDGHGQSVFGLYRDLYRKEYQFARRHEHHIVDVSVEEASFTGAAACMFGAFPGEPDLGNFRNGFVEAFEPKGMVLNGDALAALYESGFTSALRLGHAGIDIDFHGWHYDPALFVLDAHQPRDLMDFWNLRAVRTNLWPIPSQWLAELSPLCKKKIAHTFRPLPGNSNGVMIRMTVMFARSIPSKMIDTLYAKYLRVDTNDANVRQDWYPAFWRSTPSFTRPETRPTLSAGRNTFNAPSASGATEVHFECLHPDFSEEYGGNHRWANVVRIHDWTRKDIAATVFPCDYRKPSLPSFRTVDQPVLSTTEGIVIFPQFKNVLIRWELPDGSNAIGDWLKKNGINSVPSDAGRATQQIVQTLGGLNRVGDLANADIIRTLDGMSRRPITRSAHYHRFRNQIGDAVKGDLWQRRNFESLVQRNAVELGLELRCTKCSTWSWYGLKQLDYTVTCGLCLQEFGFPITDPGGSKSARWSYRVIGPFALPDYAGGGYSAALAMRFLSEIAGERLENAVTWSAGKELTLEPKRKIEADFILWYRRRVSFGQDYPTEIIFGESKSFGRDVFKRDDIENMKRLAERFPGAVLVFATLKGPQDLSAAEVKAIGKLAIWGRKNIDKGRKTRAPVIVLTGIELFASFSLDEAWKRLGGAHARLIKAESYRCNNLRVLADLTQQLYLKLPPYSSWLEGKQKARNARRDARARNAAARAGSGATEPIQGGQ
ncbi:MAG: hypothetical protein ACYC6M_12270 [Terriglobales bacterium]